MSVMMFLDMLMKTNHWLSIPCRITPLMTTLNCPPRCWIQVGYNFASLTCDIEVLFIFNQFFFLILFSEPIRVPDQPSLEPAATIEAEDLNGEEVCDPSDHEEGSVTDEEVIDDPLAHSSPNEVDAVISSDPEPAAAPGEKKSYASIVS